ncbi:VrrA/YqfQ family protein [Peribacillus sp. NPDC096540]|uniref:VrrA/YqfQ family protein n=1 Tax=Peribacillus sp. NPDC096540 TaxID=3390612 RepID=UPI003D06EA71
MFPGRNQPPRPGFQPPRPGFQPPNARRMPQPPGPFRGPQQQIPNSFQQMRRPVAQNRPQVPQGFRGPFNKPQRQEQPPAKKEGLLSRILGKSKQGAASPNLFAPAAASKSNQNSSRSSGGGILETLKNPDSLNNMLNNTQKVLQAAEQFTPMVEQYGPVIKNLPSMWKVFRSITSSDDTVKSEGKSEVETKAKDESPKTNEVKADTTKQETVIPEKPVPKVRPETTRVKSSGPKLYI